MTHLLPPLPAVVFDVGAGTGRDAVSLAVDGYDVVALEPSAGMRAAGARLHDHPRLRWLADSLPALAVAVRIELSPDVIMLNAVWQHVMPAERVRAFRWKRHWRSAGPMSSGTTSRKQSVGRSTAGYHGGDAGSSVHPQPTVGAAWHETDMFNTDQRSSVGVEHLRIRRSLRLEGDALD